MDLEKYYKMSGHLQQIEDIEKLRSEIYAFNDKFRKPINLGLFHHIPDDLKVELRRVCDKMMHHFSKLIKIEREKIKKI